MPDRSTLNAERWELLRQLNALLETPMTALSFAWLGLTVVDLTAGLNQTLEIVSYAIWGLFGLHFLLGIVIAPSRSAYLRNNWMTALALVLPAFRILRVFRTFRLLRAARAVRSVTLVRLITTLNRGMRAIGTMVGRRGVGYVVALTVAATLVGAAGMAQFESPAALREAGYVDAAASGAGLSGYGEALWWTAMVMTTMGSEYWPRTVEGRILGWLLALYAFAVFGYITATIASFFIGKDAIAGVPPSDTAALRTEIAELRSQVAELAGLLARESLPRQGASGTHLHGPPPSGRPDDRQQRDRDRYRTEVGGVARGPGA